MDTNEAILRRYVDELNQRNLAVLDEVVALEVTFGPNEIVTRDEYRQQILDRIEQLPGYDVTIDELWTDGDRVSIRWTFRGTDSTTGERVTGHAASVYRFANGRIIEVSSPDESADELKGSAAV